MKTFTFMTTDEEFINLTRLVAAFSLSTDTPFWKNVGEVSVSFQSPNSATLLIKDGADLVGYIHTYLISPSEMMISQAYYPNSGIDGLAAFEALEKSAKQMGVTKFLALVFHDPKIFERYGLKFERYLLTKYI